MQASEEINQLGIEDNTLASPNNVCPILSDVSKKEVRRNRRMTEEI